MSPPRRTSQLIREITALPALPAVATRLLAILRDPDYTAEAVTEVIRTDQALAARVLKLANSPAYGFTRDIKTVPRAVVMLGARALRSLVTAAGVVSAVKRLGGAADLEKFWRHAAYTATAARVLAARTAHPCPEEAFLLGLIHDIGELALAVARPDAYAKVVALPAAERLDGEKRFLGMTHPRAGATLLAAWNLPDDLCACVHLHHSDRETADPENRTLALVATADLLCRVRGLGHEAPPTARRLHDLVESARLGEVLTADLLHEIDLRYLETARYIDPDTAGIQAPFATTTAVRNVVPICDDPERLRWLTAQLLYHGADLVPIDTYLESPATADLILLDPCTLDRDLLAALAPSLAGSGHALAIYGDTQLDASLPHLPILFNDKDLRALLPSPAPLAAERL